MVANLVAQKNTEGNRWLSKFLRKTIRLATQFWSHTRCLLAAVKFLTLETLVEIFAPLDPKNICFGPQNFKNYRIISVLRQVLREFILHLLLSYLQTLFS